MFERFSAEIEIVILDVLDACIALIAYACKIFKVGAQSISVPPNVNGL